MNQQFAEAELRLQIDRGSASVSASKVATRPGYASLLRVQFAPRHGVAGPTLRLLRVLVDLLRGSKGDKHGQRRN